jgi:hypothetical protein
MRALSKSKQRRKQASTTMRKDEVVIDGSQSFNFRCREVRITCDNACSATEPFQKGSKLDIIQIQVHGVYRF